MSKQEKQRQLGMNPGTAAGRLRKLIIFDFAKRLELDNCYQCGLKIENIEDFTVEHKEKWLHSEDPVGLYFDLDNIAFSHKLCNYADSRNPGKRIIRDRHSVTKLPNRNKSWRARVTLDGRLNELGYFHTKEEATQACIDFKQNI